MNELLELRKYLDRHIAGLKPFPRRCGKYRQSVPNALAVADMIIDGGM